MGIAKKSFAAIALTLSAIALIVAFTQTTNATTQESTNTSEQTTNKSDANDTLYSANLTYDGETIDIYRNSYVISIDDKKDLELNFDTHPATARIVLRNLTENGDAKIVCDTTDKHCKFNATTLLPNSGLEILLLTTDGSAIRQTMLGLIIKQNAMKEKYDVPVTIGPGSGIKIDMSSIASGMSFTVNPITIPVKYEHYADGRSVLGIGTNSTDEKFWEDAAEDHLKSRISDSNLYKKWKEEKERQGSGGSLGLVWSVAGYATSYDNNPKKMTGTLQFYVGSGYNYTGQYAIFTYSVTVTWGATGEFIFTINPAADQRMTGAFNLGLSAGLELYGGIGSGYLASIGVYGAAKIGTEMNILPQFHLNRLYLSGEVGLKAKILGRDAFTFTFTSGTKEFIKNLEADGTESYTTDLSLKEVMINARDELLANDYANQPAGKIAIQQGETKWDLENLDKPTQTTNTLSDQGYALNSQNALETSSAIAETTTAALQTDRDFAHRIAENVYPHSGTQVIKGHMNTTQAIAVFANNSGELNYSIFDWYYQTMTEPRQVAGSGQDFNARFIRGGYSHQSFLVWQRLGNSGENDATLSQVAASGDIHIAHFNYNSKSFTGHEPVTENSNEIYGGLGVAISNDYYATEPTVFAYTNPANDPEGLSNYSTHEIVTFHKDEDENWVRRTIATYTGIITSFDAGIYDGRESAAFTLETNNGGNKTIHIISPSTDGADTLATFDGAWGAQFVVDREEPMLVFMQDGKLFSSIGDGRANREFGNDENKLPIAPFTIIGDVTGTYMVSYLSSIDSHQNLVGFVKSNGTENYEPLVLTKTGDNTNVTYFDGVFIGPNYSPFILYTVQNYEHVALWWEERQADMYAISGGATNHISLLSSDVTNLEDLAVTTNKAEVDLLLKNTGLFNIKDFSLYLKDQGAPDSEYTKFGDYTIPTLRPGEITSLTIELPEADYTNPHSYMLGATCRDAEFDEIGIQSEHLVNIPEGPTWLSDTDYDFRTLYRHDAYRVTIKSLGPGIKKGKIIFYNTGNLDVYKEVPFSNLYPGSETSADLELQYYMLSTAYKNLGVRILNNDEELDDSWPSGKFGQVELLPTWMQDHINVVNPSNGLDEEPHQDVAVPNTGQALTTVATASSCTICVTLIAATALLRFRHHRKNNSTDSSSKFHI